MRIRGALTPHVSPAFAEHNPQLSPPMIGHGDQLPLDFRREIAQRRLIGGMNAQSRSGYSGYSVAIPLQPQKPSGSFLKKEPLELLLKLGTVAAEPL
jgi:hypothetical protein